MDIQKIVAWAILLLCLFFVVQMVKEKWGNRGRAAQKAVKAKKAKKKVAGSFSFPSFQAKKEPTSVSREHSYELVVTLKNGQVVKEVFQDVEPLTRNEALEKHFPVTDGQLLIQGVAIPVQEIQAISLQEKEVVNVFDLPEDKEGSFFDLSALPEDSGEVLSSSIGSVSASSVSAPDVSFFDFSLIKPRRLELELTQKVVSERTGIPQKRISSIERQVVEPTVEEIQRIQAVLGLSATDSLETDESEGAHSFVKKQEDELWQEELESKEKEAYVFDFQELEQPTGRQKRKEKQAAVIPQSKRTLSKVARVGVWAVVLGLGVSGTVALGAAGAANVKSAQAQAAVETVQTQLANPEETVDDTTQVDSYFSAFLPVFLNVDPEDNSAKIVREESLKEYFADPSIVSTTSGYSQSLTSFKLYEISQEGTQRIAKYLVTYTVEESRSDNAKVTVEQLINIPFVSENGVLAISELPYYTSAPQDKGLTPLQDNSLSDESEVPSDESTEVSAFLDQFFANYATNSVEDMSYMMAEPESLNGAYTYDSSVNKVYAGSDGSYVVKSVVDFTLKETTFSHKENMTLTLTKEDGKFFVSKLTHTLGGE